MENVVITVARGFGSGGKELSLRLAEELGINCYENRILTLASQLSGYDESEFVKEDEKLSGGVFASFLNKLPIIREPRPERKEFVHNWELFDYQAKIIRDLADTESCVIVGKCADYVLRGRKNVISVYIEAPRPYCRERIMRKMNIGPADADELISKTDKYRAEYYQHYTGGNYWTNPVNYDLTLNSEKVGQDNCIEIIKHYISIKFPDVKFEGKKK